METKVEKYKRRMFELVEAVQEFSGGNGTEHLFVAENIRQWSERITDDVVDYLSINFYTILDRLLPPHIWRLLHQEVGFNVLSHILIDKKVFYLCRDCCAPLIWEDRSEGCPYCGDTFPDKSRKITLK